MQSVMSRLGMLRRLGQEFGPYLMLEILLPGGTLLALLLFLYRRKGPEFGSIVLRIALAVRVAVGSLLQQAICVPRSYYFRPLRACSQPVAMLNSGLPRRLRIEGRV
jgi:hypothetical protein